MPLLSIKQTKDLKATVELDGGEWTVEFQDPFTQKEEEELRWYFEGRLEFPMLEIPRAERAAHSIRTYGNRLFGQLFSDGELFAAFKRRDLLLVFLPCSRHNASTHSSASKISVWFHEDLANDCSRGEGCARLFEQLKDHAVVGGRYFGVHHFRRHFVYGFVAFNPGAD